MVRLEDAVCRLGERRLGVVLVDSNAEGAHRFADRVMTGWSRLFFEHRVWVRTAAGVAQCADDSTTASLLAEAARELAGNQVVLGQQRARA